MRMNFKINNKVNLSNIKTYNNVKINQINYNYEDDYNTLAESDSNNGSNEKISEQELKTPNINEAVAILYNIITPLFNGEFADKNVAVLLYNVNILKKMDNDFQFTIKQDQDASSSYSGKYNTINLNPNSIYNQSTIFHELGHAFYHNFQGEGENLTIVPTTEMMEFIQNAQNNIVSNPQKLKEMISEATKENQHCLDLAEQKYEEIKKDEDQRIENLVNTLYLTDNLDALKNELTDLELSSTDIDYYFSNKDELIHLLQLQNETSKKHQYYEQFMSDPNEGLDAKLTYSIINSIMQQEKITLPTGETIQCLWKHDDSYWLDQSETISLNCYRKSYDELMADYFVIGALGRTDLLNDLRELVGDETIDQLSNEYGKMIEIAKEEGLI